MADRVVVLQDGKISEDGSHEELATLGGRYSEMLEMQAVHYR
jgi:ATP-binding cassette subfamily B protein